MGCRHNIFKRRNIYIYKYIYIYNYVYVEISDGNKQNNMLAQTFVRTLHKKLSKDAVLIYLYICCLFPSEFLYISSRERKR